MAPRRPAVAASIGRRGTRFAAAVAAATAVAAAYRILPRSFVAGLSSQRLASRSGDFAWVQRCATAPSSAAEDVKAGRDSAAEADVQEFASPEQTAADVADAAAAASAATAGASPSVQGLSSRIRDRLKKDIEAQQALVDAVPTEDQKTIVMQEVDLNGIDAPSTILGAFPVAALSYGMWVFTNQAANYFLSHPVETDFYPVQRLAIAFQTAVVGLSSLAAGIFGFTALGILLLGLRVGFGVLTGELDPNKKSTRPERQSTAEKVRDFLTLDPVDVAMERKRLRESKDAPSSS